MGNPCLLSVPSSLHPLMLRRLITRHPLLAAVLVTGVADAVQQYQFWLWRDGFPVRLAGLGEALTKPSTWLAAVLAWVVTSQAVAARAIRGAVGSPRPDASASQPAAPALRPLLYPRPRSGFTEHFRLTLVPLAGTVLAAQVLRQAILLTLHYLSVPGGYENGVAELLWVIAADAVWYSFDSAIAAAAALCLAWTWIAAPRPAEKSRSTPLLRIADIGLMTGALLWLSRLLSWKLMRGARDYFSMEESAGQLFTVDRGLWQLLLAVPVLLGLAWIACRRVPFVPLERPAPEEGHQVST